MLCISQNGGSCLDLVWTTDPGNLSAVGNGEEVFETDENMGGPV